GRYLFRCRRFIIRRIVRSAWLRNCSCSLMTGVGRYGGSSPPRSPVDGGYGLFVPSAGPEFGSPLVPYQMPPTMPAKRRRVTTTTTVRVITLGLSPTAESQSSLEPLIDAPLTSPAVYRLIGDAQVAGVNRPGIGR